MDIEINNLSKSFEGVNALEKVDLQVAEGSICGLIGSNGAGKTTLIKILMSIIWADAGTVHLLGKDIKEYGAQIHQEVGYVPDVPHMYADFSSRDMFELSSRLYERWDWERCHTLTKAMDIPVNRKTRNLSRGMKVRLALILALSIQPRLLILDEPTSGLDPVFRRHFLQVVIDQAASRGTTVFYSTHNLYDLEQTADCIAILHQGKLIARQPLDGIKENIHRVQILVESESTYERIQSLPGLLDISRNGKICTLVLEGDWADIFARLDNLSPQFIEKLDIGLEDAFISMMKKQGYCFPGSDAAVSVNSDGEVVS